jgi:hypothetical protein
MVIWKVPTTSYGVVISSNSLFGTIYYIEHPVTRCALLLKLYSSRVWPELLYICLGYTINIYIWGIGARLQYASFRHWGGREGPGYSGQGPTHLSANIDASWDSLNTQLLYIFLGYTIDIYI